MQLLNTGRLKTTNAFWVVHLALTADLIELIEDLLVCCLVLTELLGFKPLGCCTS